MRMNIIPESTKNYSSPGVRNPGGSRQCSHYGYMGLYGKESDFTMSDLISIGVLYAREYGRNSEKKEFYQAAFGSLRKAFGNPDVSEFLDILGIIKNPKKKEKEIAASLEDMFRQSGIIRFLWFRAKMIEMQDPFWNVMEGDIWGISSHPNNQKSSELIQDAVDFYGVILSNFINDLPRLDKAICAHLGWKYEGSISLNDLVENYNFPDASLYFDDDY